MAIADAVGYPPNEIVVEQRIYGIGVNHLIALVQEMAEAVDDVMVFGHNPTMTQIIGHLSSESLDNLPTCGVAQFVFDLRFLGEARGGPRGRGEDRLSQEAERAIAKGLERMPPDVIEVVAPLIALMSIGTMALIGMKMRLSAKIQLQKGSGGEDLERIADAVEGLHDELRGVREDVAELQERVDFAERLLSSGEPRAPKRERAPTPV